MKNLILNRLIEVLDIITDFSANTDLTVNAEIITLYDLILKDFDLFNEVIMKSSPEEYFILLNKLVENIKNKKDLKESHVVFKAAFRLWLGDIRSFIIFLKFLNILLDEAEEEKHKEYLTKYIYLINDIGLNYSSVFERDDVIDEILFFSNNLKNIKINKKIKLTKKNILYIEEKSKLSIGTLIECFGNALLDTTQFQNILSNEAIKYIKTGKDVGRNIQNIKTVKISTKIYLLAGMLYKMSRYTAKELGIYKDNIYIETTLKYAEDVILKLKKNTHKNHHYHHRLNTLISAFYGLKIRYNEDNNLWDNNEILKNYYKDIVYVLDAKYFLNEPGAISKVLEDLGKIENYKNKFKLNEPQVKDTFIEIMKIYASSMSFFLGNNVGFPPTYIEMDAVKRDNFNQLQVIETVEIFDLFYIFLEFSNNSVNKIGEYEEAMSVVSKKWRHHVDFDKKDLFEKLIVPTDYVY